MADTLLVIEDEDLLGNELVRHYRRDGWNVIRAANLAEARTALLTNGLEPLVVLSDMSLPDGNALDLLEQLRAQSTGGEWILLTGYGTVPDSVRALRCGAYDFLEKPCPMERLDLVVAGAGRSARAQRRLREQTAVHNRRYTPEAMVGTSPATRRVREMLQKLSHVPFSALVIAGETGTGKGLAARILHYSGSRAEGPLVELNCAALPAELLESELFGHEPGAFTGARGRHRGLFERANGGTLFLDEIGELTPALQAKLLKAVEDRRVRRLHGGNEIEVDVQLLAASNRNLTEQIEAGAFRQDLYHRLSVFQLHLPALRERIGDLEDLVPLFVAEFNAMAGKRVRLVSDEVWTELRAHSWPGNVRELRNVIERCVLFSEGEQLPAQWLQLPGDTAAPTLLRRSASARRVLQIPLDGSMSLDDMDRYIIERALELSERNVTAAARALGTTRQTLRYRVQKYGLKSTA